MQSLVCKLNLGGSWGHLQIYGHLLKRRCFSSEYPRDETIALIYLIDHNGGNFQLLIVEQSIFEGQVAERFELQNIRIAHV